MTISNLAIGALAGLAATVPMTKVMKIGYGLLPRREQYPLPPSEIVEKVSDDAGVRDDLDRSEHVALTYASHFGYGAATGALYAPIAANYDGPALIKGAAYGLAVWVVSYLGILPGLGILRPATEHPARRNALMITAHLVWGSALGAPLDLAARGEDS
jgi:uncharacterized membrane protein YagU involved in acid resistance